MHLVLFGVLTHDTTFILYVEGMIGHFEFDIAAVLAKHLFIVIGKAILPFQKQIVTRRSVNHTMVPGVVNDGRALDDGINPTIST